MCLPGQPPAGPSAAMDAVAMVRAGLAFLAAADTASLPTAVQADCLRELERAESMHTAARASMLSAFAAGNGFEDDGQGSAKTWLRWQTQLTAGAAAAAMAWVRRLAAHPAVREALAAAAISAPFARQICDWSDLLPAAHRGDADAILLAAAAGGAELADLAGLAEEMRRRTARPDAGRDDDGFADRWLRLETTFGGAGRLEGDLTPPCAAALGAVLGALGKKAGPEDTRTRRQREHDAVEEASAPRGAVLYRSRSGQGWEELSLDLMADLEPKGEGDNSMPGNRQFMPRRLGWRAGRSARYGESWIA